jgi:hypothetical protein
MDLDIPSDYDPDFEADFEDAVEEGEDWDEETLGLDWNEADALTVMRDVLPRDFAD